MPETLPARWRALVGEGMARLAIARFLVAWVPLRRWSVWLGPVSQAEPDGGGAEGEARMLARAVVRAAALLPFHTKCLPRAIAFHTMLRRRGLPSKLVIAALDPRRRGSIEDLHAWVESAGEIMIGEIDQPFHPVVRFG